MTDASAPSPEPWRRTLQRGDERVSPQQIMRLALLVLLAAFCVGLAAAPRTGDHASQGAAPIGDVGAACGVLKALAGPLRPPG